MPSAVIGQAMADELSRSPLFRLQLAQIAGASLAPMYEEIVRTAGVIERVRESLAMTGTLAPTISNAHREVTRTIDLLGGARGTMLAGMTSARQQIALSANAAVTGAQSIAAVYARGRMVGDIARSVLAAVAERRLRGISYLSRTAADWLRLRPARVDGIDEQTAGRRRRSVDEARRAHARQRALLARRSRTGDRPGQLVSTHPQATRGPNAHKSITYTIDDLWDRAYA